MDGRRHEGSGGRTAAALAAALAAVAALACAKPGPAGGDHRATADCWACHGDRYLAARDPDHQALGFPRQCSACHGTGSWDAAIPDAHGDGGPFPLQGRHRETACADCHGAGAWGPLDPACAACHRDDYDGTTAPAHGAAGFPATCADCHGFDGWRPAAGGPHGPGDAFPLAGRHAAAACADCHGAGPWADLDPACAACHRDDYDGTTAPAHGAAGFPTTCADCHRGFDAWTPATAGPHGAGDAFPLEGGHGGRACGDCHRGATFADVPRTCDGCHAADYDASANPAHGALALPRDCRSCHGIQAWTGATLGAYHRFPVDSGRHAGNACSACHPAGQPWKAFTCLSCHEHSRAETDGHHGEVSGYTYDTAACYRCHPQGTAEGD